MKPLLMALMLSPALLLGGVSVNAASDRDAADRQTRQESDELRADIRQQRLKKIKTLDGLAKPKESAQQPNANAGSSKAGE